jgi:hypothetical protein
MFLFVRGKNSSLWFGTNLSRRIVLTMSPDVLQSISTESFRCHPPFGRGSFNNSLAWHNFVHNEGNDDTSKKSEHQFKNDPDQLPSFNLSS